MTALTILILTISSITVLFAISCAILFISGQADSNIGNLITGAFLLVLVLLTGGGLLYAGLFNGYLHLGYFFGVDPMEILFYVDAAGAFFSLLCGGNLLIASLLYTHSKVKDLEAISVAAGSSLMAVAVSALVICQTL
jgi:hypothetical protein